MSDDHIRAALKAAETSLVLDGQLPVQGDAGRAVLAFLRALPHRHGQPHLWSLDDLEVWIDKEIRITSYLGRVAIHEDVSSFAPPDRQNIVDFMPRRTR